MNQNIPKEILDIASSSDIDVAVEQIADRFNLHIDQVGDLDASVRNVLLGSLKASEFTDTIIRELSVSREIADEITKEINDGVLKTLKTKLQSKDVQTPKPSDLSALEKVGDFTIEPEIPEQKLDVSASDRPKILNDVENPKPAMPRGGDKSQFTEPLVDHLLANPAVREVENVVVKPIETPKPARTIDPYKEAIN